MNFEVARAIRIKVKQEKMQVIKSAVWQTQFEDDGHDWDCKGCHQD
jgi:hypothetical protein